MGAWRNNGNDIAVCRKRARTFYSCCFSGSCRCCQDQAPNGYLFVYLFIPVTEEILVCDMQVILPSVWRWHSKVENHTVQVCRAGAEPTRHPGVLKEKREAV